MDRDACISKSNRPHVYNFTHEFPWREGDDSVSRFMEQDRMFSWLSYTPCTVGLSNSRTRLSYLIPVDDTNGRAYSISQVWFSVGRKPTRGMLRIDRLDIFIVYKAGEGNAPGGKGIGKGSSVG